MASKSSKTKTKPMPFIFSCIFFLMALTFFTIRYLDHLHNEFQIEAQITQSLENPKWFEIIAFELGHNKINVALVNTDGMTKAFHTEGKIVEAHFDRVNKSIKWSDLYPEWIDENGSPNCPNLPMPRFEEYKNLDAVVAKVPCGECNEESGLRDVFRLQVNLVVANLLVRSGRNGKSNVFAVFVGEIEPMWEIFRCDDLLWNGRNVWVYKPELWRIKHKVAMPVGSCQLAPPFAQSGEELWRTHGNAKNQQLSLRRPPQEAYVTVVHSSENFVCGAIVLAQSIIQSNSTKDLILLADDHISPNAIDILQSAGWNVRRIQRVRSPHSKKGSYNEWNYSKLRIWQLTDYDKLIFIDSDLLVVENLDGLFNYPQISAVGNDIYLFNSGVMVIEPSDCTFRILMKKRFTVGSYNGGDQGFLNEMFPWWHRLSHSANDLKFFVSVNSSDHRMPDNTWAIHYLGWKPWLCYRDYDCNWDKKENWHFASDSENERWWRVYDTLPKELRGFCRLLPQIAERIEENRRKSRDDGNYADQHWRIKIQDPRRGSNSSSI